MAKIEYELNEEDFMGYAQYHFRKSDDAKASFRRTIVIGLLALGVYAFGIKDDPNFGIHAPGLFAARVASVVAVFIGFVLAYMRMVRPMLVRGWLRSAAKRSLGHTVLEVKEDGVHVLNVEGQGRLAWAACRGVVDAPEHVYIVMGPLRAFVVPKRAFGNAAQAEAFLAEARERFKAAQSGKIEKV